METNVEMQKEILYLLGYIALTARRAKYGNTIPLFPTRAGTKRRHIGMDELVDTLQRWLDSFDLGLPYDSAELAQLLELAHDIELLTINPYGDLSFRQKRIADQLIAGYLSALDTHNSTVLPFGKEFLEDVKAWNEPITLWAGLSPDPMILARRLADLERDAPEYAYQALLLSLACIGVARPTTQSHSPPQIILPHSVITLLEHFVRSREARKTIAAILDQRAREGGNEVYRSLLPLLPKRGMEDLFLLLDKNVIAPLLFEYLIECIDKTTHAMHIDALIRVLGSFRHAAIPRAIELSQPETGRGDTLRAAAIRILGATGEQKVVEALIPYLQESDTVRRAAIYSLVHLGSDLVLDRIIEELDHRRPSIAHGSVLDVLRGFLDNQISKRPLTPMQYKQIAETIIPTLSSAYDREIQQRAKRLLRMQTTSLEAQDDRREKVIDLLIDQLTTNDVPMALNLIEILKHADKRATPLLTEHLKCSSDDKVRVRIVEILGVVRDIPQALPHILPLLADHSSQVQEEAETALIKYAPDSVLALIEIVLSPDHSNITAINAANVLKRIGDHSVVPIMTALPRIVPHRTHLLVQALAGTQENVLEGMQNKDIVPTLTALLETVWAQQNSLLVTTLIKALATFKDQQVTSCLLTTLSRFGSLYRSEISHALANLGTYALDKLVAALDSKQETVVTGAVCDAILLMTPFPCGQLLVALAHASHAQTRHILAILQKKGPEAAPVIIKHLCHSNQLVQTYSDQLLKHIDPTLLAPLLVQALKHSECRSTITTYLLNYSISIPLLVNELADSPDEDSANIASESLMGFGVQALPALVQPLNDHRHSVRGQVQLHIAKIVHHNANALSNVIQLFALVLSPVKLQLAYDALLDILTNDLADSSVPFLLNALEADDTDVRNGAAAALACMVDKHDTQSDPILQYVVQALHKPESRLGAADALEQMGPDAVKEVGKLITDKVPLVADTARRILVNMGPVALSFIASAYNDASNLERRLAVRIIFSKMPTEVIGAKLIELFTNDEPQDNENALLLLINRINDEAPLRFDQQKMMAMLFEYVQMHRQGNQRIMALLLSINNSSVLNHLIYTLRQYPDHEEWLIYLFLLLNVGTGGAKEALHTFVRQPNIPYRLLAEAVSVLGMMDLNHDIEVWASSIGQWGIYSAIGSTVPLERRNAMLEIALRALGGLLAGGKWNIARLKELRNQSPPESPQYELLSILLGDRYLPQLHAVQQQRDQEREQHRLEISRLNQRISDLEKDLSKQRQAVIELQRENDALENKYDKLKRENDKLRKQYPSL